MVSSHELKLFDNEGIILMKKRKNFEFGCIFKKRFQVLGFFFLGIVSLIFKIPKESFIFLNNIIILINS